MIGLAKATGIEYAETGTTVNTLAPALIKTEMSLAVGADIIEFFIQKHPMKRHVYRGTCVSPQGNIMCMGEENSGACSRGEGEIWVHGGRGEGKIRVLGGRGEGEVHGEEEKGRFGCMGEEEKGKVRVHGEEEKGKVWVHGEEEKGKVRVHGGRGERHNVHGRA